jgi:hypothetical protein
MAKIGTLHNNGKIVAVVTIDNNLIFHFQLYTANIGNFYYPVKYIRTRELKTGISILSRALNHSILLSD